MANQKLIMSPTALGEVVFEDYGSSSGPPVVLIPGLTLNSRDWPRTLVNGLVRAGYRVLAMDLPDSGASQRLETEYSADQFCEAVKEAILALELPSFHLVGLSLGGLLIQKMALPKERVESVVFLMSCACTYPLSWDSTQSLLKLLKVPLNGDQEIAFYHSLAFREHLAGWADEHGLSELRTRVFRSVERGWPYLSGPRRQIRVALEILGGTKPDFSGWVAPTLILHGDRDPLLPPWSARVLHGEISGSRLIFVKGMGHEFLERYNHELLTRFLTFFDSSRTNFKVS